MSNPNEWVWLTHEELGDSPNPVLRSALHHWLRIGWEETDPPKPPEPDVATDAQAIFTGAGAVISMSGAGVREEKPKARPRETAASPAATTE